MVVGILKQILGGLGNLHPWAKWTLQLLFKIVSRRINNQKYGWHPSPHSFIISWIFPEPSPFSSLLFLIHIPNPWVLSHQINGPNWERTTLPLTHLPPAPDKQGHSLVTPKKSEFEPGRGGRQTDRHGAASMRLLWAPQHDWERQQPGIYEQAGMAGGAGGQGNRQGRAAVNPGNGRRKTKSPWEPRESFRLVFPGSIALNFLTSVALLSWVINGRLRLRYSRVKSCPQPQESALRAGTQPKNQRALIWAHHHPDKTEFCAVSVA